MTLKIGDEAFHEGRKGIIMWVYANGQCEFKSNENDSRGETVVHISNLVPVQKNNPLPPSEKIG